MTGRSMAEQTLCSHLISLFSPMTFPSPHRFRFTSVSRFANMRCEIFRRDRSPLIARISPSSKTLSRKPKRLRTAELPSANHLPEAHLQRSHHALLPVEAAGMSVAGPGTGCKEKSSGPADAQAASQTKLRSTNTVAAVVDLTRQTPQTSSADRGWFWVWGH